MTLASEDTNKILVTIMTIMAVMTMTTTKAMTMTFFQKCIFQNYHIQKFILLKVFSWCIFQKCTFTIVNSYGLKLFFGIWPFEIPR